MAVHKGKDGQVKLVTTGGSVAVITELKSWSVEESIDTMEVTTMGASAKTFLTGTTGWTGSVELNYDAASAVHQDVIIGADVDVEFYPTAGAAQKFTGSGFVTSHARAGSMGDLVSSSVSIQGDGALTVTFA